MSDGGVDCVVAEQGPVVVAPIPSLMDRSRFGSHVDGDRLAHATEAGFEGVMPRSVFVRRLPELLYGKVSPPPGNNG